MRSVEIRCPIGPRRLLFKMLLAGERPHVDSSNLIELACVDCTRTLRKKDPSVLRVLHRYDLAGSLVESVVQSSNGKSAGR